MLLSVVTILAVTGITVNGQITDAININSCPGHNTRLGKCNSDTTVPDVPQNLNHGDVIDLGFNPSVNMTIACTAANLALFRTKTKCVLSSYRQCGDNDYKTLAMEDTAYDAALTYLCNNVASLTAFTNCLGDSITNCVTNKQAREKVTSGAKPDISEPFKEIRRYHCKRMQINEECVAHDTDFAACIPTGSRALFEEFYRLKKPSACGASSIILASGLMVISLVASFVKF